MINLADIEEVKAIQSNVRASLGTPQGAEVIKFLEAVCGWFDFSETDPNTILVSHGRRQVLATIKTFLELTPEQIVAITKQKES